MGKDKELKPEYFLNRLAMQEMANTTSLDPFRILANLYYVAPPGDLQGMLRDLCNAAITEKYSIGKKSPGDILFYADLLEQLIEACYLIYTNKSEKKQQPGPKELKRIMKNMKLPVRLSEEECANPGLVIDAFFSYQSLPKWKLALYNWLEAALSSYSVAESIEPAEILSFSSHMEKLVDAGYCLAMQKGKRK